MKILYLLPIMFILISCNLTGIKGNGDVVEEVREIEFFEKIDVSGNFNVEISAQESFKLEIISESNLLKYIKTKVKNNTLFISSRKNLRPTEDLSIIVQCPNLYSIECSGMNDIFAKGINCEDFEVDLSGAGSISLSGEVENFKIDVSGAADLMARDFFTKNIRIDVSGAANAEVYASLSCDAEVSGAGYIELYGDAEDVNMDISGAGSLERR